MANSHIAIAGYSGVYKLFYLEKELDGSWWETYSVIILLLKRFDHW